MLPQLSSRASVLDAIGKFEPTADGPLSRRSSRPWPLPHSPPSACFRSRATNRHWCRPPAATSKSRPACASFSSPDITGKPFGRRLSLQNRRPRIDHTAARLSAALRQRQSVQRCIINHCWRGRLVHDRLVCSRQEGMYPLEAQGRSRALGATPTLPARPDGNSRPPLRCARDAAHGRDRPRGRVVYMAPSDDTPNRPRLADVKTARNMSAAALDAITAGHPSPSPRPAPTALDQIQT